MLWVQALSFYTSFPKYRTFWSVTHLVRMYSNVNGVTCLNLLPLSSFSSLSSSSSWYTTVPICLLAHVAMIEPLISGNIYNENRFEISTRLIRFRLQLHYPLVMITRLYLNFDFPSIHLLLYDIPLLILFLFLSAALGSVKQEFISYLLEFLPACRSTCSTAANTTATKTWKKPKYLVQCGLTLVIDISSSNLLQFLCLSVDGVDSCVSKSTSYCLSSHSCCLCWNKYPKELHPGHSVSTQKSVYL